MVQERQEPAEIDVLKNHFHKYVKKVMMWRRKVFCIAALFLLLIEACLSDDDEEDLAFIGDSLVARWDLQEYFPSRHTGNYGVSGSGIAHIEDYKGYFVDKDVVVIIGTNDLEHVKSDEAEYAERYVDAVLQLGAEKIYLFSIFPRSFENDADSINYKVARINGLIKERIDSTSVHYIDVFDDLSKGDSIDMQYSYDGLHLSTYGYELISSRLKELL